MLKRKLQGIIALDIDGTLTDETHLVAPEIIERLSAYHQQGWKFIFITGRTFSWGFRSLKVLPFPYYLSIQNGAVLLEMPSKKMLKRKYIDLNVIPVMENICFGEPSDFVIYGGIEHGDNCFFRPQKFDPRLLDYLYERCQALEEFWTPVETFDTLSIKQCPSIKCFGFYPSIERIADRIEQRLGLHVPPIRDPFKADHYVAQATHPEVNKGYALTDFVQIFDGRLPIIAAGDDNNDCSMLAKADVAIVMETAPRDMLEGADIIAPAASKMGIIEGLEKAVTLLR